MIPTRKQWRKWSLPSKLTAIGVLLSLLGVVLSILSYISATDPQIVVEDSPDKLIHGGANDGVVQSVPAGAVINNERGIIFLIQRENSVADVALTESDVALCLRLFSSKARNAIGISLDPNPNNGNELNVRFIGPIEDTHLAYLLFRADIALKEYALGYTVGGEKLKSEVTLRRDALEALGATRYWLEADPAVLADQSNSLALVGGLSPRVISDSGSDYLSESFTAKFSEVASERREFADFLAIVQVVAIARWLSSHVDSRSVTWVREYSTQPVNVPAQVPDFQIQIDNSVHRDDLSRATTTTKVVGGVRILNDEALKISGSGYAQRLFERVRHAPEFGGGVDFSVELDGDVFDLYVLGRID